MKSSMKDKAQGAWHQLKGNAKKVAGKVSGKPDLEFEGKVEHGAGKAQEKSGEIKKVTGR
jgi:uncharacterized protein YjbJ (UPF0337 family)